MDSDDFHWRATLFSDLVSETPVYSLFWAFRGVATSDYYDPSEKSQGPTLITTAASTQGFGAEVLQNPE